MFDAVVLGGAVVVVFAGVVVTGGVVSSALQDTITRETSINNPRITHTFLYFTFLPPIWF